jgi:hypothetical protein
MSHKCREIDFKFMEGSEESSKNGEFNAGTTFLYVTLFFGQYYF